MASSDSSSEEGSSAKPSTSKQETRRLTSVLGAAYASPQHVATASKVVPVVDTPPKAAPKFNLLDEVEAPEQREKSDETSPSDDKPRLDSESDHPPNLIVSDDTDATNEVKTGEKTENDDDDDDGVVKGGDDENDQAFARDDRIQTAENDAGEDTEEEEEEEQEAPEEKEQVKRKSGG